METTIERMCLCALKEPELLERADSMALEELKIESLKADRKKLNAVIGEHTAQRMKLARTIEGKAEMRPVPCAWHYDRGKDEVVLVRSDTREEVERRPMTDDDRQMELPEMNGKQTRKARKARK